KFVRRHVRPRPADVTGQRGIYPCDRSARGCAWVHEKGNTVIVTLETEQVSACIPAGRSTELSSLLWHAARARAGRARAVLVRGPAGIGRTSLLSAATKRLLANGVTVRYLGGRPGDGDGTAPGRAVDALLAPHSAPAPVPPDPHTDRRRLH